METKTETKYPLYKDIPIIPQRLSTNYDKGLCLDLALTLPIVQRKVDVPHHLGPWPLDHDAHRKFSDNIIGPCLEINIRNSPDLARAYGGGVLVYTDISVYRVAEDQWLLAMSFHGEIHNLFNKNLLDDPNGLIDLIDTIVLRINVFTRLGYFSERSYGSAQFTVYNPDANAYRNLIGKTVKGEDKVITYYINDTPQNVKPYINGVLNGEEVVYSYQGAILGVIPWRNGVKHGIQGQWLFGFSLDGKIISAPPLRSYYWLNGVQVSYPEYAKYLGSQIHELSALDRDLSSVIGQYYLPY